jgi:hypothetical protein
VGYPHTDFKRGLGFLAVLFVRMGLVMGGVFMPMLVIMGMIVMVIVIVIVMMVMFTMLVGVIVEGMRHERGVWLLGLQELRYRHLLLGRLGL